MKSREKQVADLSKTIRFLRRKMFGTKKTNKDAGKDGASTRDLSPLANSEVRAHDMIEKLRLAIQKDHDRDALQGIVDDAGLAQHAARLLRSLGWIVHEPKQD